ncbi:MAG: cytochrome-c oxidase, cbb3-type subunit III [Gammaproteobacteria bacterium]|nr:cytochrome-c oxidase, cbb3-type subunit III [Gammaproteobacteria bacterium]
MTERRDKERDGRAVQTTGHSWDGDIQEYNNPLPRWWLWAFYATVVFAVIYWLIYPAWPVGAGYTKGPLGEITYEVDGETRTSHWNTRARLLRELQSSEAAQRRRAYLERIAAAGYGDILRDPEMMDFTRSVSKGLFGDNCAACHGPGGAGRIGHYPSLVDDAWLWGGRVQAIEETIRNGRRGFMPAFAETFDEGQLTDVAGFVLSLSGHEVAPERARRGAVIFRGEAGGCYYCHTRAGTGLASQGAADLTDGIWTAADVPGEDTLDGKLEAVKTVIREGVTREMPGWGGRLSEAEIKLLTVHVYELGAGR